MLEVAVHAEVPVYLELVAPTLRSVAVLTFMVVVAAAVLRVPLGPIRRVFQVEVVAQVLAMEEIPVNPVVTASMAQIMERVAEVVLAQMEREMELTLLAALEVMVLLAC